MEEDTPADVGGAPGTDPMAGIEIEFGPTSSMNLDEWAQWLTNLEFVRTNDDGKPVFRHSTTGEDIVMPILKA